MAHTGSRSLLASSRSAGAQGPALNITNSMRIGMRYQFSVWVRTVSVPANVNITVRQMSGTAQEAGVQVASNVAVGPTRWTHLRGTYTPPYGYDRFQVRVETGNGPEPFYIDDFTLTVLETTQPPVITNPASGSVVASRQPTIIGVGPPFTTVTVTDGPTVVCRARVDKAGDWRCEAQAALAGGGHTVTPTVHDAAGNATAGTPVTFTVSAAATPAPPVILLPRPDTTLANATVTVSGTGPPSGEVLVSEDGRVLCGATVLADGTWRCTPGTPFSGGRHTIYAAVRNGTGPVSSARSVTFGVDTSIPWPPTVRDPAPGATANIRQPVISGTGEPGVTVRVTIDRVLACVVTVGFDQSWRCVPDAPVPDGQHLLVATAVDAAGNWANARAVSFFVRAS
ncbi:hypothetical protein GCM10009682_17540 [Luedemannella flava]|uniref:Bacterial Ig-like domain-containing protein n=1 Tax=Luedemannella flava TaxID=349316 RepID=A0ABN2LQW8_9ACTN